jgi:hypothetical protein
MKLELLIMFRPKTLFWVLYGLLGADGRPLGECARLESMKTPVSRGHVNLTGNAHC